VVRLVTPFAVACESNNWSVTEFEKNLIVELERGLVAMSDCVIPISLSIEKTFMHRYGLVRDSRWHILPAGIAYWPSYEATYDLDKSYDDLSQWPEIAAAKQKGKFIFLFLSRLEIRKGVDILLAAIKEFIKLHTSRYDYLFVFAGKDCMELHKYLSSEDTHIFKGRVLFTGEVSLIDRERLYSAADVVIFPSRYESFGLVPLEAFVYGKPVIGSNVGAIPEVVEHNQSGLLFKDGNPNALADCIDRLLGDPQLYRRLAEGARQRVRELSSVRMAEASENIYRSLLQSSRPENAMRLT
jgi:glycosyltransferase involved in cell wall biosynthesis